MDIAFLLDSSGSITPNEFQQAKDFIELMANSFLKNKVGSRVGLIQYSIVPTINARFSDGLTSNQFRSVLDKVVHKGGYTRLDRALLLAGEKLFSDEEDMRKDIPKVLVVITDGINTDAPDFTPLDTAVAPLRRAGVRVFIVCIGSKKGLEELYLLTQQREDFYHVKTYNDLALQLRRISKDSCESGGKKLKETLEAFLLQISLLFLSLLLLLGLLLLSLLLLLFMLLFLLLLLLFLLMLFLFDTMMAIFKLA